MEAARIAALTAKGFWVVLVDVCGFGVLGDGAGDAYGLFSLPSYAFRNKESSPVDTAFYLNRSLVAIHVSEQIGSI